MKNSAVFIALMLGVCLNSAEAMQQQKKTQLVQEPRSIVEELRARSRKLTGDETSASNELLKVLDLSSENTEVRIIGAATIVNSLPFDLQACKERLSSFTSISGKSEAKIFEQHSYLLKGALLPAFANPSANPKDLQEQERRYQYIVKQFFYSANRKCAWPILRFFKEKTSKHDEKEKTSKHDEKETRIVVDETIRDKLCEALIKADNILLRRAVITFIATRIASQPTIGAQRLNASEIGKSFNFIMKETYAAGYNCLQFDPDSTVRLRTLMPPSEGAARIKTFTPNFQDALLHEFGHLIDNMMTQETPPEDITGRIMHFFVEKKEHTIGFSSKEYTESPSEKDRIQGDVVRTEVRKTLKCRQKLSDQEIDKLSDQEIDFLTEHYTYLKQKQQEVILGLDTLMSAEYEFCDSESESKSSVEFWQIIGLRLIKEADGKQVLYVNKFSDFYNSLISRKPIRLDHLEADNELGDSLSRFQYMTDDIYKVYRALAEVHQINFDQYLSDLESRSKAAQAK